MKKAIFPFCVGTNFRKRLRKKRYYLMALFIFTFCLISFNPHAYAQQSNKIDSCSTPVANHFNFLIGKWRGEERASEAKTAAVSSTFEVEIKKLLGGCALQENWDVRAGGKKLFSAVLLRAFDVKSGKWMLSYVDDQQNFQFYEGRKENDSWAFYRERTADGKTVQIRVTWQPYARGFMQRVERSNDGGQTWSLAAVVTYARKQ